MMGRDQRVPLLLADLKIYSAQPGDADAVARLARLLSLAEGLPPPKFGREEFLRDGCGPDAIFSVLLAREAEAGVIAYLLHYPGYDVGQGRRGRHLADLFVLQPWRRQGVARAMVRFLAKWMLARGEEWLSWHAYPGNDGAIEFYERLGAWRPAVIAYDMRRDNLTKLVNGPNKRSERKL